jgi:hypothetical protein
MSSQDLHNMSSELFTVEGEESIETTGSSYTSGPLKVHSVANTPTKQLSAQSDKFDFAFRCVLLGNAASFKRQWVHLLAYGKYSKEAAIQDALLEQAAG